MRIATVEPIRDDGTTMNPRLLPADLTEVETLLPELVRTIVAVIGLPDAIELVRQAGGTTLNIPRRHASRAGDASYERLIETVGASAADVLVRHFDGESGLYIPRCQAALLEYTYRQIRREFDRAMRHGQSARYAVKTLARAYRYSDRHIWSILKAGDREGTALEPAPGQMDLFA